jgi:hypothetical protein
MILIIDNNRSDITIEGFQTIVTEEYSKHDVLTYPEHKWHHPVEMCEKVLEYITSRSSNDEISHIITRSNILLDYLRREVARKNIPPFDGLSVTGKEIEKFSMSETGFVSPWPEKSEILNFSMKIAEDTFRIQVENLKNKKDIK